MATSGNRPTVKPSSWRQLRRPAVPGLPGVTPQAGARAAIDFGQLRSEIYHTEAADFKAGRKEREALLQAIIGRLESAPAD
jgi:hypothetical protein